MSGWGDVDGGYISSDCYPAIIGLQSLLLDFVKKKNPVNKKSRIGTHPPKVQGK